MSTEMIHDRGRGPEIAGTRMTVYDLLRHFLDPDTTEGHICRLYELEPEQVAAARAYVLNNADVVLDRYMILESRAAGARNSPEVIERVKETHTTLPRFKEWLGQREQTELREQAAETPAEPGSVHPGGFPGFREWLAGHEPRPGSRT